MNLLHPEIANNKDTMSEMKSTPPQDSSRSALVYKTQLEGKYGWNFSGPDAYLCVS